MSFSLDPKFEVEKCRCSVAVADAVEAVLEFLEKQYSEELEEKMVNKVLEAGRACSSCPVACFSVENCVTKASETIDKVYDGVGEAITELIESKRRGEVNAKALKRVIEGLLALQLGCTLTFKPN